MEVVQKNQGEERSKLFIFNILSEPQLDEPVPVFEARASLEIVHKSQGT